MTAQAPEVVLFHYAVSTEGTQVEASFGGDPIAALLDAGNIIPGLEAALKGRAAGDRFEVEVSSDQAYGPRNPDMEQRVPRKLLRGTARLLPGSRVIVETHQGTRMATVVKLGMTVADLDFNHPLAGKDLRFDIEVVEVRAATSEELAHGHAHGPGGHHHH